MASVRPTSCCGLFEVYGLTGDLLDLKPLEAYLNYPHFLFTDNENSKRGDSLFKLIEEKKLGTYVCTDYRLNPNSKNNIKAWLFTPEWEVLTKFLKRDFEVIGEPGDFKEGDLVTAVKGAPYSITTSGRLYTAQNINSKNGMCMVGGYPVEVRYFTKVKELNS